MDALQRVQAWVETLDFSDWTDDEDVLNSWLDLRDAPPFRVGLSDLWLDRLRAEYKAGRFPHGTL